MNDSSQKLSFLEKTGYSMGDAAANFVFMTMILFQTNFYTDVFGISAASAGAILLIARLWDAFFDPVMGILADRTVTRWGKFRPWILFTAVPWSVVMVLAYTTPTGWSMASLVAYAAITNILMMTLYSCNNMPYAALGGVMTADLDQRAKLNSYRFIAVNAAQFIVGGLTLPLVAKFAEGSTRQHGWQMTMTVWAVLCLVLFIITFATTKERVKPVNQEKTSPIQDLTNLLKNSPWIVMVAMTLVHFGILSFRGGALYNYYHHYADKGAMYDWLNKLGLVSPAGVPKSDGVLEWLGYIVHGDKTNLENSNVADVANSIINMVGTFVTMVVIMLSPSLSKKFGKKAIAVVGFALSAIGSTAFYFLQPADVNGMLVLTILIAIVYAPTIPLIWAIYADVADYSEWTTGHRTTGIVFATIGFALKCGLALGSASFLWIMAGIFNYDPKASVTADTLQGFRSCSSLIVGLLFAICTVLLMVYKINKKLTIQIADELAERRLKSATASN
jgi:Na+/melibiose symporter-like transporter